MATALLAAGCTSLVPPIGLEAPKLALSDLAVLGLDRERLRIGVTVEATNPNARDLPLSDLSVDLELVGRPLARGQAREASFVLPAGARRGVPLEFVVPLAELGEALRALARAGAAAPPRYRLSGAVTWGSGPWRLPFSREGEATALRAVATLLRAPASGR